MAGSTRRATAVLNPQSRPFSEGICRGFVSVASVERAYSFVGFVGASAGALWITPTNPTKEYGRAQLPPLRQ